MRRELIAFASLCLVGCATSDGPAASPLAGTSWKLVALESNDDSQGRRPVEDPDKYTLAFGVDGTVAARLDCNRGTGPWAGDGASLTIGPLAVTRALCPPPSLGDEVDRQLGFVRTYVLRDGRLYLNLMADGGNMVWERQ